MTESLTDLPREVTDVREERGNVIKRPVSKDDLLEKLQKRQAVFAVFGYPLTRPGDRELLGLYSTYNRAADFYNAQSEAVRSNLGIVEIEIDRHPSDDFWVKP